MKWRDSKEADRMRWKGDGGEAIDQWTMFAQQKENEKGMKKRRGNGKGTAGGGKARQGEGRIDLQGKG
mgnify:CR=1 FL=1